MPVKISIITAVFNSEETVSQAISSVAKQSYVNLEHLVIEGKSTDTSLSRIHNSYHERMRLISEPDNGIYDALNKGIKNASGDVVGFVHSDDFLPNDQVLDKVAKCFEDATVEAVFGDLDYVSKNDTTRIIRHWRGSNFSYKKLRHGWMPAHPTFYLRREVYERIGYFDLSLTISSDYDLILRYFTQQHVRCMYIPSVLYKMRVGGASNRNFSAILHKIKEDLNVIRQNRIGGIHTLLLKNLSKFTQFLKV